MGANSQDAKEIVQESLYRGFLNIYAIPTHAFRSWLYKVPINQWYDLCWRRNRNQVIEFDEYYLIEENSVENTVISQQTEHRCWILGFSATRPFHTVFFVPLNVTRYYKSGSFYW